jgi:hypothetical protein
VQIAFVLNLPADELTRCAQPQSCIGLPHLLEIDKAPVEWYWRPVVWPVANHLIHRPLRVWSLDGPDTTALDALERGEAEDLRMPAPTAAQQHDQLTAELAASLAHLRRVEADFWEPDWRSAHRGSGVYPEHHLWDAVHGYLELLGAVQTGKRIDKPDEPDSDRARPPPRWYATPVQTVVTARSSATDASQPAWPSSEPSSSLLVARVPRSV